MNAVPPKARLRHILITGGTGFIGSHTAEAFLDRGWQVTILDDLSSGRLSNLEGAEAARVVVGDKTYLLRVFVDVDRHPAEVVTVYLTSRIAKYWRAEP